jgi:hypothetical protein
MATVEQTMMKIQRILTGPMGLRVQLDGQMLTVGFADSSTEVRMFVLDWGTGKDGEPRTLVRLSAPILWGVRPSPALFEWIAKEGGQYFFGHVSVTDDPSEPGNLFVFMSHTLLGDYLDEDELAAAMWGVLGTADDLDDQLQQRFGGKRLADT